MDGDEIELPAAVCESIRKIVDAVKKWVEQAQEIGTMLRDPMSGELNLYFVRSLTSKQLSRFSPGAKAQLEQFIRLIRPRLEISSFDLQSLVVQPGAWALDLVYAGHVDADGKMITVDYEIGKATPAARAKYSYRCIDCTQTGTTSLSKYRQVSREPDLLEVAKVLSFLRHTFVSPVPSATPMLPEYLSLPTEVTPLLEQGLRTFLDSLPAPFTWRMESSTENLVRTIGASGEKKIALKHTLKYVKHFKELGNDAFRKNDCDKAIDMYTRAINVDWGLDEIFMGEFIGQEVERKKALAICYANRAAAHLLPGECLPAVGAISAILDGKKAEELDPTFKKAYIRQIRGHTILGQPTKAKEVLDRALARKELAKDSDLLEALAVLRLDGLQLDSQ